MTDYTHEVKIAIEDLVAANKKLSESGMSQDEYDKLNKELAEYRKGSLMRAIRLYDEIRYSISKRLIDRDKLLVAIEESK